MKVGFVGCGEIARVHAVYVQQDKRCQIIAVCDQDLARARALAHDFRVPNVYQSLSELLEQQRPDAIHVLTPPHVHASLAIEAMQARCHVLVEKPMALSLEEADSMIEAAERHGVKLCVDHNQLFDPVVLEARELISKGAVGKVIAVDIYYGFNLAQAPERRWAGSLGGGMFQDVAPHPLSHMLQFLEDPIELHATTLTTRTLQGIAPDELRVLARTKDTLGTVTISFAIKPHLNFLNIYGSKAILHVDLANMIVSIERLRSLPKPAARALMVAEQALGSLIGVVRTSVEFSLGRLKPYPGMGNLIRRFYDCIESGQAPPVPGEAGRRVVRVFEELRTQLQAEPARQPPPRHGSDGEPTVFVTGATGFLGSHLVERLTHEGVHVRALVRPSSRITHLKGLDIDWVDGDLSHCESLRKSMAGCDVVYHCAAATTGSWNEYEEATVKGTERILSASTTAGVRRIVYVSSLSVYAVTQFADHALITEDAPIEPHPDRMNYYARAKIHAEYAVLEAQQKGLPIAIVRPGIIYGPRGQVFFPTIGFALNNRMFVIIGRGNRLLPLTYVGNVVDAILLAGTQDEAVGHVYNIVDDDQITQRQYVKELIKGTGGKGIALRVPFGFFYSASFVLEKQAVWRKKTTPPLLTRYRLLSASRDVRYDTTRAKKELHWQPVVSLEEGLKRTFEWHNRR